MPGAPRQITNLEFLLIRSLLSEYAFAGKVTSKSYLYAEIDPIRLTIT
jgi:hypothetical protein